MKAYNVEIFDRELNFKYSTLINSADFSYAEDYMDPVKNTVVLPLDFVPSKLAPADNNAPKGWYIRILTDTSEYQGVITVFEAEKESCRVTYSQMITLLNLNLLVEVGALALSTIENYIAGIIRAEFINSRDTRQNITGLSAVTVSTSNSGTLPYTDTDEDLVSINILDDLVYPAFELYAIYTDVRFNAQTKSTTVAIGKSAASTQIIEADLPSIIQSSFTIQKYSKQVNKIDCYDIYLSPPERKSFYLHGATWDDNPGGTRFLPVVNQIITLDGWGVAKSIIDAQLAVQNLRLQELNGISGALTNDQMAELNTLAAKFMPPYVTEHQLSAPTIEGSDPGTVIIGTTTYDTDRDYDDYNYGAEWLDEPDSLDSRLVTLYRRYDGHILLMASVSAKRTRTSTDPAGWQINEDGFDLGAPVTAQNIQTALGLYKKTTAYETEIRNIYNQVVAEAMEQRADAAFAKNKYSNLIELTMLPDNNMVSPMDIGTPVNIIHNGVSYSSMLTGRSLNNGLITLSFGTIRLELTSYLKGRY